MVKKWMKITLVIAGIYNIIWGSWIILFPTKAFELTGAKVPAYPIKHWPITFVGLLGKVFGPIGFIYSIPKIFFHWPSVGI